MNFQIAGPGRSFKGAMAYYLHDKRPAGSEEQILTRERVAWTETRNLMTDDPDRATRIMIGTAERSEELKARAGIAQTGRKGTQPVMAYSLAWHPGEAGELDRDEMVRAAEASLKVLGLEGHQAVLVAHRDTAHPHVHVIVSLWVSTAVMQVMMVLVYFSNNAWNVMLSITGVMILPAYLGSAGYLWKLIATGQYPAKAGIGKAQALTVSILGTLYGFWLVYAAGLEYMLGGALFFALGNLVFIWARREHAPKEFPFKMVELVVAVALVALGALAIWMLLTGRLGQVYSG